MLDQDAAPQTSSLASLRIQCQHHAALNIMLWKPQLGVARSLTQLMTYLRTRGLSLSVQGLGPCLEAAPHKKFGFCERLLCKPRTCVLRPFLTCMQEFQRKSQAVAGLILRGLAIGLGQPEDFFLGVCTLPNSWDKVLYALLAANAHEV